MEQLKISQIQASVSKDERTLNIIKNCQLMGDNFFRLKISPLPSV